MPKKVKVVNVNDDTTYADIAEAVVENESDENENIEEVNTVEVNEPEPPKPKARAKRVSKPKALARTETVLDADTEIEPETEFVEIKPKPKRVAKVKVVEQPIEKPTVKKDEPLYVAPTMPVRMSRAAKREELYHSLASNALP
jgi:hypothetical protein